MNNTTQPQKFVFVASDDELRQRSYFQRLAIATAALNLPRREIPNHMADVIFGYRGKILWRAETRFPISPTAIDDVFNGDDSFRWLSDFLRFALQPPAQSPQFRVVPRLRLIDLMHRIEQPNVARHFGR